MAIQVFTNPQIIINAVDLSGHIDSVTLEETVAAVETTAFGATAKTYIGGLGDHKFTIEFQQDFAAASVEATVGVLVGLTTNVAMKPLNASTSTTNPSYSFVVLVDDWKPLDGKVGDLLKSSVTWPISGGVTKANS